METTVQEAQAQAMAIKKRCPACGTALVKQYDPDLECECWICPAEGCGYIEPIL